MTMEGLA
jgi:hypothetical protein